METWSTILECSTSSKKLVKCLVTSFLMASCPKWTYPFSSKTSQICLLFLLELAKWWKKFVFWSPLFIQMDLLRCLHNSSSDNRNFFFSSSNIFMCLTIPRLLIVLDASWYASCSSPSNYSNLKRFYFLCSFSQALMCCFNSLNFHTSLHWTPGSIPNCWSVQTSFTIEVKSSSFNHIEFNLKG